MTDKNSKSNENSQFLAKDSLQGDLMRLTKKQLIDRILILQNSEITDYLEHELQVHQVELEMQNRELREAQSDLEITRDRYADLYDFAPVGYMTFCKKGIVENINITGSSMLKAQRINIIGKPFILWLTSSCVITFFDHIKKVIETDEKIINEFKLKINNSGCVDVRMESVRSLSENKKSYLCQSVIIDITESKRKEEEIHLQARQLKLITDSLPLQVAYLNADEEHLFVNKKYTDWFGVTFTGVIGKLAREFWSEQFYARIKNHLKLALMGKKVTFEMHSLEADSSIKYINVIMIPDFDINHLVSGVIIIFGDITDRLADEVVDRQRLLDAAHLSRLNTMGEMASEIAHELNQPLAAISIYSEACKRIIQSPQSDENLVISTLNDISEQAERAGQIIRHIRSLVSKKELMLTNTNVNELVKSAMKLLEVELRSHNVQLSLNFFDDIPSAYIDKILIEQVIINLSRNAIDAMDAVKSTERFLAIDISLTTLEEFQVCIKDTGMGLTKNQIDTIFQPFKSTKVDGMGLGLVICQSIVDAHHGSLWVDSKLDKGTMFCFKIPLMAEGFQDDK
ncbi:MAG: ATP-binding protein [Gammaproteobacteria bacterium]|nr:ATP-binding protein [Gammaproteobacteria bacterium]